MSTMNSPDPNNITDSKETTITPVKSSHSKQNNDDVSANEEDILKDSKKTDDDSKFESQSKKRKRNSTSPIPTNNAPITTRNAFEILMNTDLSKSPKNSKQLPQNTNNRKTKSNPAKTTTKVKPPPIKVQAVFKDPKEAMESMKTGAKEEITFHIRPSGIDIYTQCEEDFTSIKQKLAESKTPFFTYTTKGDRPVRIVLKGVHSSFTPLEIKEELIAKNVPVTEVYPMYKKGKVPIDMFLVHLSKNAKVNEIKNNVKYMLNQVIRWTPYEKKNIGTQCRKCQSFGHAATNCGMLYRCVKCTHKHDPNECPLDDNSPPKCVNCNENHTANSKNCNVYKEYVSKISESKRRVSTNQTNHTRVNSYPVKSQRQTSMPVTSAISYSEILRNEPPSIYPPTNPSPTQASCGMNFLSNEITSLFSCNITELLTKIKVFVPVYNQQTDNMMKKIMIIDFLAQFA